MLKGLFGFEDSATPIEAENYQTTEKCPVTAYCPFFTNNFDLFKILPYVISLKVILDKYIGSYMIANPPGFQSNVKTNLFGRSYKSGSRTKLVAILYPIKI